MTQRKTPPFLDNIASNLREARLHSGFTQQQLAEKAGVSRRTLVGLESGSGNCSLKILGQLVTAMGGAAADIMKDRVRDRSTHTLTIHTFSSAPPSGLGCTLERNTKEESGTGRSIILELQAGDYCIARLAATAPLPQWADGEGFVSISRSKDELSIVCLQERVPEDIQQDREWICLKFLGPFPFGETGIVLSVIRPLSLNSIGVFVVSTYDGDHLLVKQMDSERALTLLRAAGHKVLQP